ncbi:MAG: hypothetical protein J6Y28_08770 [Acholeplasmatales bacterium]|nr:hypothetical protein [Acholeplasmatales bacterium]
MNDYIDVKLAFSNYIHNIVDVIYRYINNSTLKKVLILPLFIIILLLEFILFPLALVGALARLLVGLLYSVSEDRAPIFYTLLVIFVELFLLYYAAFAILWLLYKLFNLASRGVGASAYTDADSYVNQFDYVEREKKEPQKNKQEKQEEVYVINDENYM